MQLWKLVSISCNISNYSAYWPFFFHREKLSWQNYTQVTRSCIIRRICSLLVLPCELSVIKDSFSVNKDNHEVLTVTGLKMFWFSTHFQEKYLTTFKKKNLFLDIPFCCLDQFGSFWFKKFPKNYDFVQTLVEDLRSILKLLLPTIKMQDVSLEFRSKLQSPLFRPLFRSDKAFQWWWHQAENLHESIKS